MSPLRYAALAVLVVATTAVVDFAHARYARAVTAPAATRAAARCRAARAAAWSLAQWCATTVGFACAVYVSPWLLPWEAVGLVAGTLLAAGGRGEGEGE